MSELQNLAVEWAWVSGMFCLFLLPATRYLANVKAVWAGVGLILIVVALGNTMLVAGTGIEPSRQFATLAGALVFGGLGVRLFGNWLTDGAT